jgi:DNA-directed RNA polymerase subunit F
MTVLIEELPITMAELKAELAHIKERDEELTARSNKVEEYVGHFVDVDEKKAVELKKSLEGLNIPRLKDLHVCKITDLLPRTVDELKTILQGYTITVSQDNMKKIVETVKGYI